MVNDKRGAEWISTILYVLISIAILGALMVAVRPKISELKDQVIITQTVDSLNVLDDTLQLTKTATGTNLRYNIKLNKGNLIIDPLNDKITWQGDSSYIYSEPGKTLQVGRINALTTAKNDFYQVTLDLDYKLYNLNLTFDGLERIKTLNPSSIPYTIWLKNNGRSGNLTMVDLYLG